MNELLPSEFEKAERVFLHTPSSLSLGSAIAINWDIEAYDRVVERMIRGLHWHHIGVILGDKALVKVKYLNWISKALATTFDPFPVWSLGNGQLLYKLIYHETHPYQSAWVFQSFDRKWADGYVSPINETSRKCD
jgi:hypothetical protein